MHSHSILNEIKLNLNLKKFDADLAQSSSLSEYHVNNGKSNNGNRPELKRYRQYTRHDIAAAIEAVRSGQSALQASRLYGVPSRTLYDKVRFF
jgi:hypothetical protein